MSTTYLHQAVKDPLLVIEKQWTSWDGRFPMHMLLYTIPVKQQRDCYWKWRLTSRNNVKSSKNPGKLGGCVYKQIWTSNQGRTGCSRKQHQEHCCMLSQVEIGLKKEKKKEKKSSDTEFACCLLVKPFPNNDTICLSAPHFLLSHTFRANCMFFPICYHYYMVHSKVYICIYVTIQPTCSMYTLIM